MLLNCEKSSNSAPLPVNPPTTNSSLKFLSLGDSYTIGQSVPASDRFPVQTAKWLKDNGINMDDPMIIATTGWTTVDLKNAIASRQPLGMYDIVSLLIGVNDQYQRHDTTGYRDRFTELLSTAIVLAGNRSYRVFVVSIPDYSVTPFAQGSDTALIHLQIDQFNAINKTVTSQYNCQYLDITPSTRQALNDPALLAGDGLHPSGKEYKKWADRLGPMMKTALQ